MNESKVAKFYESKKIFITGGTGFLGKVLIEKLLRSTDVGTIYILIRVKKGKNASSRLEEIFKDELFEKLKKQKPNFINYIEIIPGDCRLPDLGISLEDKQKLISNVNVIFHLAATVHFMLPLKIAVNINVNATKGILDLATKMKYLKSFIHVSTAYANYPRDQIDEKLYNFPVKFELIDNFCESLEKLDAATAEMLTLRTIHPWPNTYTFTKAMAEQLIKNTKFSFPIGVFRPSVIISSSSEPIIGWTGNLYGSNGVAAGFMCGSIKVMQMCLNATVDIVPVDVCAATLIVTAWDVSKNSENKNINVYNCVSGPENPVTCRQYMSYIEEFNKKWPYSKSMWPNLFISAETMLTLHFLRFLLHILPALFIDLFKVIKGEKPRTLLTYRKKHKLLDMLGSFSSRNFNFSNENVVNLWEKLEWNDRNLFPMTIKHFNWLRYFDNYVAGLRKYVFKDPESNLEEARKRYQRMKLYNKILFVVTSYFIYYIFTMMICNFLNLIQNF